MKRKTIPNTILGGACALALAFTLTACGDEAPPATEHGDAKPAAEGEPTPVETPTKPEASKPEARKPDEAKPEQPAAAFDPSAVALTPAQRQKAQWALLGQAYAASDPTKVSPTAADVAVSPASLTTALQALWWGTRGETALEIARLFGAQPGAGDGGAAVVEAAPVGGALGGAVSVSSGTSLWLDAGFPLKEDYLRLLAERGMGEAQSIDWSDPGAAVGKVNSWVAETTGGKIPTLLDAGDIRPPVAFALASVISFQGSWVTAFDPKETHTEDFTLLDGERIPAAYMSATRSVRHATLSDGTALLELPFAGGGHRFVAVLPGKAGAGTLRKLERRVAAEAGGWLGMLEKHKVAITLPKFEIGTASDPAAALQALGVEAIFGDNTADFSGLSETGGLKLDVVRQRALVKIDEAGAEAVGATAAVVTAKGDDPDLAEFRADRPFLFFILSDTGDVLFGGRTAGPQAP